MITKKTLRICISTDLQGQFLCLDNYSAGWAFCPLTGYFTLPFNKNSTYAFFSAIAACAAARRAIGTRNGEQDT